MQYQIVASDLDKTLLGDDRSISRENWLAIEKLHARGIQFVPASGRAYEEMPVELLESPLIRYYIASDGASVHDKKTGKNYELAMPQALGHRVLDVVFSYPVNVMIHADTNGYVDARTHNAGDYADYHMNDYWIEFALDKEKTVPDLKSFAYSLPAIQSVVPFFKNMEDLIACRESLSREPGLLIAQTDPYNLEIFSASAGKGNALRLLADVLGADRSATIAVGDSTNDYTMVMAAGLGLAMSNAVPELKAAADAVICSNNEHAAKYILEHYIEK